MCDLYLKARITYSPVYTEWMGLQQNFRFTWFFSFVNYSKFLWLEQQIPWLILLEGHGKENKSSTWPVQALRFWHFWSRSSSRTNAQSCLQKTSGTKSILSPGKGGVVAQLLGRNFWSGGCGFDPCSSCLLPTGWVGVSNMWPAETEVMVSLRSVFVW